MTQTLPPPPPRPRLLQVCPSVCIPAGAWLPEGRDRPASGSICLGSQELTHYPLAHAPHPTDFQLPPGPGQPLEVGEVAGAGALVLGQALAWPPGELMALGCPCPGAEKVVSTAQLPLRGVTCTHYTVTCTNSKDVDMPMSPIRNTHTGICRPTVPGTNTHAHAHTHTHS